MRKILIINESSLIRDFLQKKLESLGLKVLIAMNGFDGHLKMRNQDPDLIILDYFISRVSSIRLLKEKNKDPNTAYIPVIVLIDKLSKDKIMELSKLNVKKFFAKPIKMDSLINAISELMGVELEIDTTPCIIDAHFNDGILFIELARGLNREKADLLKFKIAEILKLYRVQIPKVLIIMTDIEVTDDDSGKLKSLLSTIQESTRTPLRGIKILTTSESMKRLLLTLDNFSKIEVTDNIKEAMDKLLGIKVSDFIEEGLNVVKQDFLLIENTKRKPREEAIHLRFNDENIETEGEVASIESLTTIAIVDDDPIIREFLNTTFDSTDYHIKSYENGRSFIEDIDNNTPDLIFLDIIMPEMDGFAVLQNMKAKAIDRPVIILSGLTQKETVIRAMRWGVKSYLSKPLKPEDIMKKTEEVLKLSV